MRQATSPSRGQLYGLARVCRVWGIARSTVSWQRRERTTPAARRGPLGPCADAEVVDHLRRGWEASPFPGAGSRTVGARRRPHGLHTSPRRVRRLRRAHQLLAPTRPGQPHGPPAPAGTLIPAYVETMWGTDRTATGTRQAGQVAILSAVEHGSAACVGLHAAKQGPRFAALEPIRQGVGPSLGAFGQDSAQGWVLRHAQGSQ
jgi:putative transposase